MSFLIVTSCIVFVDSVSTLAIVGVLRGGGDVRMAAVIDIAPLWLAAIPAAAFFGLVLEWGVFWVYVGISLDQLVKFFVGIWRLRSGAWINDVTLRD